MEIIEIKDKDKLDGFAAGQKHSQFLQSFLWGEFQKKVAGEVFRLGVGEDQDLAAAATIVKKFLPMGKSYFYCPRGPVIEKFRIPNSEFRTNSNNQIPPASPSEAGRANSKQVVELLFYEIRELARKEGAMFLRFEPEVECKLENWEIEKTLDVQPSRTLTLDLMKAENELLEDMRPKTRYNIRLAEKKKIKVEESGIESFDKFWELMGQTSDRDNFRLHGIDYYKEMLKFGRDFIKIFFARHKGEPISTGIFSFFGNTATYMHGASSNASRNLMAPYALQWEVIKLAKKMGYKYYDFFGIDEKKWPGVTRFKKGFGGQEMNYPGTFDLIFDSGWYSVYKMVRKVRRTF
ncbi:MAG: peptidoglycan bridge formation glycyltransferase FemA/FemB family protein [Patescibacteria group bacterium]|nr:peptidoglycan bridge formation glycyltransferase FemA/FemB family protein [Patescibacteria group bacterium]